MALADTVSWQVVDHYENPRNVGSLDRNAKNVGTGLVGAPACGDVMKLQVTLGTRWHLGGLLRGSNLPVSPQGTARASLMPALPMPCPRGRASPAP